MISNFIYFHLSSIYYKLNKMQTYFITFQRTKLHPTQKIRDLDVTQNYIYVSLKLKKNGSKAQINTLVPIKHCYLTEPSNWYFTNVNARFSIL